MEIEWTDEDPETGAKRFVRAERFARKWRFSVRPRRRTNWEPATQVTRGMWETLLDALERRYPRREGVTEEDLTKVRAVLASLPAAEEGISPQRHEAGTKGHKEEKRLSSGEESGST